MIATIIIDFSQKSPIIETIQGAVHMTMTEKIEIAMIKQGIQGKELAKRLGCTSSNLSAKFRRNNLTERDLNDIAEALDCRFEGKFIKKIPEKSFKRDTGNQTCVPLFFTQRYSRHTS